MDRAAAQLDKALAGMRGSLGKLAAKGQLGGAKPDAVLSRLQTATEVEVRWACHHGPRPGSAGCRLQRAVPIPAAACRRRLHATHNPPPACCMPLPPPAAQALATADFIVEAVPESEALKRGVFQVGG